MGKPFNFLFRFVSYFFIVKIKVINHRRRLEISASKFLQKIQIGGKYFDKHVKIIFETYILSLKNRNISEISKKRRLLKFFEPI